MGQFLVLLELSTEERDKKENIFGGKEGKGKVKSKRVRRLGEHRLPKR